MTTNDVLTQFQQQEAEQIALSMQFNRWSLTMIEQMIAEQEQKLLDSGMPVATETSDFDFWEDLG